MNFQDKEGKSSIFHLIKKKDFEIIDLLINKNIDINLTDNKKNSVLFEAIEIKGKSVKSLILKLLKIGANINWSNEKGDTPLIKTLKNNYINNSCVLINEGADLNRKCFNGFSSLDFIFVKESQKLFKALERRVRKGRFLKLKEKYNEKKISKLKKKMEKAGIDIMTLDKTCDLSEIKEELESCSAEKNLKSIKKDILILNAKFRLLKRINKRLRKL